MIAPPVDRLSSPAAAGLRVDDHELIARQMRHGLGDPWLATRPQGAGAVVKFIGPAEGQSAPRDFDEHVKRLMRVTSPNLVTLRGGGVFQGWLYVITEAVEARTFDDWLVGQRESGAPVPAGVALHLFDSLCGALQGAHRQGVAHGALSPSTVLLRALSPGAYHAWVLDLGLGRWLRDASTVAAVNPPPVAYLAPEQDAGGDGTVRSDVFSLALLLVELLCGTAAPGCGPRETFARGVPRLHKTLPAVLKGLRPDVHEDFWTTLASALHPDAAQRPESAQQLKSRVRAAAQNAGLWRDTPEPAPEPPAPRADGGSSQPAKSRDEAVPEGWQHSERVRVDPNAIRALMAQSQVPRRKTVAPAAPEPTPSAPPPPTAPAITPPPATIPMPAVAAPEAERTDAAIALPDGPPSFSDLPDDDYQGTVRRPSLHESSTVAAPMAPRRPTQPSPPARPTPAPPQAKPAAPASRLRSQTRSIQEEDRSAFQTLPASRGFGEVAPIEGHPGATMKVMRVSVPGLPTAIPDELEDTTLSDPPPPRASAPVESTVALYAPPGDPPDFDKHTRAASPQQRPMTMPPASYAPPASFAPPAAVRATVRAPMGAAPFVLKPPDAPQSPRPSRWWIAPAVLVAALLVAALAWWVALPNSP